MKNLNAVSLKLGRKPIEGKRSIGFYEGPYSRTAQVSVPDGWEISVLSEYDDADAAKIFDERKRTVFCVAVSPDGKELIGYRWRMDSRMDPVHLKGAKAKEIGADLNTVDPAEIAEKLKSHFKEA